jgi:hypothetical protein
MRVNGKNTATLWRHMNAKDMVKRKLAYCHMLAHLDPSYPVAYSVHHLSLFGVLTLLDRRLAERRSSA